MRQSSVLSSLALVAAATSSACRHSTCPVGGVRAAWAKPAFIQNRQRQGVIALHTPRRALVNMAKPKRGSVVDSYQTVSVNCNKCGERLFRYKKKNGTKSNLVKCYVERINEDSAGLLAKNQQDESFQENGFMWNCPYCATTVARSARIRGMLALKLVGGKVRMTKK